MKPRTYFGTAVAAITASLPSPTWASEPEVFAERSTHIAKNDQSIEMPAALTDAPKAVVREAITLSETPISTSMDLISDETLDALRGGNAITVGNQTLVAVNSGGVINGDFSAGAVNLSDNAFSGFNGFGNLVINTGAQNNLQSGMNVTINFAN
jgi:hypothetical protein